MIISFRSTPRHIVVLAIAAVAIACGRKSGSGSAETASAQGASPGATDTATAVRGTVANVSPTALVIKTDTGSVTVMLVQPFQVYDRAPGSLDDVKNNSFVGVTTVKQADGSEKATESHIFPEELRGMGEGSRMMTPGTGGGGGGRMTNGAMSGSRMTNGMASPSRMSNGSVANANGSMLDVQYSGGSQKITVPPNTSVTEIKATSKKLAAGDQVIVLAKKGADGSLSAGRALLAGK